MMRLRLATVAAIGCVLTTMRIVTAQTAPTVRQTLPSDPDRTTAITVIGCLQRNTTEIGNAIARSGSAVPNTTFILTDARPAPVNSTDPTRIVTPDEATVTSTVTTYRLDGAEPILQAQLGHTVEISGGVEKRGGVGPAASEPATSIPTVPRLTVTTIKSVGTTCTK
jgi:hypothetical protein